MSSNSFEYYVNRSKLLGALEPIIMRMQSTIDKSGEIAWRGYWDEADLADLARSLVIAYEEEQSKIC